MKPLLCLLGLHKFSTRKISEKKSNAGGSPLGDNFTDSTTTTEYEKSCTRASCDKKEKFTTMQITSTLKTKK